jgi:hypothetical protein
MVSLLSLVNQLAFPLEKLQMLAAAQDIAG